MCIRDSSWDEALPGDLVFYPEDSHVGIVGGRDESGNLLIITLSPKLPIRLVRMPMQCSFRQ